MEFSIDKEQNPNIKQYDKDTIDISYKFASKIYKEMGDLVKAVILFGSAARKADSPKGDIDILVIVDDVNVSFNPAVVNAYRVIVQKTVADVSSRLHITSLKLTSFWEYVRAGDPVGINVLRDGVALIDTGFFDPLRALLKLGRIRPSPEAVWSYYSRAPRTLHNSKWHIIQATLDLYWAVIDAAHAALMTKGFLPPGPEHVADMLEDKFVKEKMLESKYAKTMRDFYKLQKQIMYREIKEISGKDYEQYFADAQAFVRRMESFLNQK